MNMETKKTVTKEEAIETFKNFETIKNALAKEDTKSSVSEDGMFRIHKDDAKHPDVYSEIFDFYQWANTDEVLKIDSEDDKDVLTLKFI